MTDRQKKGFAPSDEGVIIGKGNVFSGPIKVGRDFIAGDQINITRVMQTAPFQPPASLEELRNSYLAHLQASFRALDFKGIPQLDTFSRELLLEDVYIPLLARPERPDAGETWQRPRLAGRVLDQNDLPGEMLAAMKGEAALPVKAEEALAKHKRVVVLGDPGSGKSTLLKYLSLRLAAEANAPLPIPVPLNAYADALEKGTDTSLQCFLSDYYASRCCQTEALGPLFDAALQNGQAVVLLDGLDEVQTRNRRRLVERIEFFAAWAVNKNNRLVVTSRIVGYGESPLNTRDWQLFTLIDFDRQAIEAFAARWCLAFEKSTLGDNPEAAASAERERRSLLEALEVNSGVAQLASNPLLLTILALIKRQGVSLPNRRVELYELYLKTLITSWSKARALDKRPVGPEMDYLKTIAVLAPLALWLREENPSAGLVSEEHLVEWLTSFFQGEEYEYKRDEAADRARDFLNSVRTYSNLLIERGQGRYGFIHLTFEEMLAARALVQKSQLKLEDSLAEIRRRVSDPAWRETLLLAVGIWGVVREQPQVAAEVVRAMLKMDCEGESICRNVLLAGACLEDVGESGVGRKAANEIREALLSACRNRGLPPAVQRDAGFCLGRTGWVPPDLDEMIFIPAGSFLYGEKNETGEIKYDYQIGKYPVTNLQYRRFIEADGYENREFWSETGWSWRDGTFESQAPEDYKKWLGSHPREKRTEPFFWHDPKWNNPLAPVVGVTWFEAEAYANWLSRKEGRPFLLPSELEWERAARGTQGREFAWGDKFNRKNLNGAEFWSGQEDLSDYEQWTKYFFENQEVFGQAGTTIVCQFLEGGTPESIHDLSGNIWEWTSSWYEEELVYRVLRGGSWYRNRRYACGAYRNGNIPDNFDYNVGFRLFSPGSDSSAS